MQSNEQRDFSIRRISRFGVFQIGSALSDLLTSAVWNRILITDLGIAAWPVALLTSVRYLLAPFSIWIGHRSDHLPLYGFKRLTYVWSGRLLMLFALALLPLSVVHLANDPLSVYGWMLSTASFILYGFGTAVSGAPFLALIKDSFPYEQQGRAIGFIQIFLILGFSTMPIVYARLMPEYSETSFLHLVGIGIVAAAFLWLTPTLGLERRVQNGHDASTAMPSLGSEWKEIWKHQDARRYAAFVGVSAAFAFMQDVLLEPFGGDVFGLSIGDTTRFNAYWGSGVLVGMLATYRLTKHRAPHDQVSPTLVGLGVMAVSLAGLGVSGIVHSDFWIYPSLVVFGLGFGMYGIGGYGLLIAMSGSMRAGLSLAIWSVVQLSCRGFGMAVGGVFRDLGLWISGSHGIAYGAVFILESIGLLVAIVLLIRIDFRSFAVANEKVP